MANIVNKQQVETVSQVLAKDSIKDLANNLGLSNTQIVRAKATALSLSNDEKLKYCSAISIVKYCYETARYNFSRDDDVYPVPFRDNKTNKTHIQTQLSYKGLRELALRSNAYRDVNATEVYKCDRVSRDRETGKFKVIFEEDYMKTINSELIGFFAYALDKKGELVNSLFWTVEQCKAHGKQYSKSFSVPNSLWNDKKTFNKMAKKTVIKQLCAELKTTPELELAIKQDQAVHTSIEKDEYLDNAVDKTFNDDVRQTHKANAIDLEEEDVKVVEEVKEEIKTPITPKAAPVVVEVKEQPKNDVGIPVNPTPNGEIKK